MVKLAASVLRADPLRLGEAVEAARDNEVPILHIDVMDGRFGHHIAFGPDTVAAMRPLFPGFFDLHLIVMEPERHLERFAAAGANGMTVHLESTLQHHRHLPTIRALGCRAGLAINAGTPLEAASELLRLEAVDTLLLMSVNPGYPEPGFLEAIVRKIDLARSWRELHGWTYEIAVDGGIDATNASAVAAAGVDVIVSGRGLYGGPSFAERAAALRRAAAS